MCGILPDQFWDLTPAELNMIIEVYVEKKKDERKSGIITAFYSAYFSRLKTLSSHDLEKALKEIEGTNGQKMSDEEMLSVVKQLAKVKG